MAFTSLRAQNYYLLRQMITTDFKLRYQGSVLGYLWTLVRPLAFFSILYVVFQYIFKVGNSVPHYPVYLLLGIVLWTFFLEATNVGLRSIVDKGDLIRKVNVPKYLIVVAPVASGFINLLLNLVVVVILAVLSGVQFRWAALLLPLLLLQLLAFSVAVSFLLSAFYVRFRDVLHIWDVVSQVLFYATPIVYPLSLAPKKFIGVIMLNPLAQVIQDARCVLVAPETIVSSDRWPAAAALVPLILTVLAVLAAAAYFRASSRYFAENI